MTSKSILFTRETYDYLKEVAKTGTATKGDYLGYIAQGAVCCDLILMEDPGFRDEDYCFGEAFVIDCSYYLLGKYGGYGERKGIPYDCLGGFYGYLLDTYEETLDGLINQFDEYLNEYDELVEGVKNTELTWMEVWK